MRKSRIKAENGIGCYHVTSRIVDRSFKMDVGEREIFRHILRKAEAFSGVNVLTYAILSNHFHILLDVPEQPVLDDAELLRRVRALYGGATANLYKERWDVWRRGGVNMLVEREQEQLRRRMGDVSPFMKLLKQRYSICYNQRHKRTGTLWEGRYVSILVEGDSHALSTIAAYIDLNPVRAGIVKDPAEYRWSGYGEACGGSGVARQGLHAIQCFSQQIQDDSWSGTAAAYRTCLYTHGEERRDEGGRLLRVGFSPALAQEVIDRGGRMALPDLLRCRVRYFRDGLAFGSRGFVESVFERNRSHFSAKRKTGARRMRFCFAEGFCIARDLRVEPISVSLQV
jgi:REP element-mobilizing transposase RayT